MVQILETQAVMIKLRDHKALAVIERQVVRRKDFIVIAVRRSLGSHLVEAGSSAVEAGSSRKLAITMFAVENLKNLGLTRASMTAISQVGNHRIVVVEGVLGFRNLRIAIIKSAVKVSLSNLLLVDRKVNTIAIKDNHRNLPHIHDQNSEKRAFNDQRVLF